jgi:hypothetical protein
MRIDVHAHYWTDGYNTSILDRAVTDPQFEPVFTELDRRGAILESNAMALFGIRD